jgi:hypothetical protein
MITLGLDNGVSGALCALSPTPGVGIIAMTTMPIQRARKGNEIDVVGVWQWLVQELQADRNRDRITAVLEEPGGSKSARAATSMAGSFHALRALFQVQGIRFIRITPQQWQKPMLHCKAGDTKPAALSLARQLWPTENWLASERCKVPHDGLVDSALIAEYARRNNL